MRLGQKLILILLSFIVIPQVFLGLYYSKDFYETLLDNTTKATNASLQQIRENLRERLLTYIQMSNMIISHTELKAYLDNPPDDWQEQLTKHRQNITNEIGRYSVVNPYLRATVYVENDRLLVDHRNIEYADEAIRSADWYLAAKASQEAFVWRGLSVQSAATADFQPRYTFAFARPLHVHNRIVGVLQMEIEESHLYALISEEAQDKDIYIVNPLGEIVSSNRREALQQPVTDYVHLDEGTKAEGSLVFKEQVDPQHYALDWRIYAVIPESELLGEAIAKRNVLILITSILSVWVIATVSLLIWKLSGRIRMLAGKMHSIRRGRFGEVVAITGKDEISDLGSTFNLMSIRLKELVEEVYENKLRQKDLEIKQKQTELKALQSQINPHFLFNTLDSIRTGALRSRDEQTVEKIELLSEMFRKTLNWQGDFVTLESEMGFVSDYVRLQQLRFKDKIEVEYDIDPATLQTMIPKFIIQPIVENAIIHGIEKSEHPCKLQLSVHQAEDDMRIVVKDDGVGFTPQRLAEIIEGLNSEEEESERGHIGLRNVHSRIQHIYGAAYGLQLAHNKPRGAIVTLRLPYHS